jgi:exopolysaccharide biosynthesis polyprenyl glycosylphosphotransferase
MLKRYSGVFTAFLFATDGMIIACSFAFSHVLIPGLGWQYYYFWLLGLYLALWPFVAAKYRFYSSKRTSALSGEVIDLVKIAVTDTVLAVVIIVFLDMHRPDPALLLLFNAGNIAGLFVSRLLVRSALKSIRRKGYNYRSVLIIGTNERTMEIVSAIKSNSEYGLRIIGILDTEERREQLGSFEGYKIIGSLGDLKKVLTRRIVDEVYITLPVKSFYNQIEEIIRLSEAQGIEIKLSPSLFPLKLANHSLALVGDIPLIKMVSGPTSIWKLIFKRGIDIIISSAALIAALPVFIVIPILIKLDSSRGPVFFRQKRVGYNMRRFTLLKFRTMVENAAQLKSELQSANEVDGPVFKIKNDPRITRVGRLLRRYSLDELPQLLNVLKGDMSLVGPRPPLVAEVNEYEWWQRRRLSMKPGITCFWQVSGRNKLSFADWMALDLKYIDNWSLRLDAMLLLRTIPAVFRGSGL